MNWNILAKVVGILLIVGGIGYITEMTVCFGFYRILPNSLTIPLFLLGIFIGAGVICFGGYLVTVRKE